jgi:hypothetical protein
VEGDDDSLRQAVEAQAQARVVGDIAKFASYMTPQALMRLHRQGEPLRGGKGIANYEVLDITMIGLAGSSDVQYSGSGSYVLRTRWERPDGLWRAVMVEMPPDSVRGPWWRRVLHLERRAEGPSTAERRDLR